MLAGMLWAMAPTLTGTRSGLCVQLLGWFTYRSSTFRPYALTSAVPTRASATTIGVKCRARIPVPFGKVIGIMRELRRPASSWPRSGTAVSLSGDVCPVLTRIMGPRVRHSMVTGVLMRQSETARRLLEGEQSF
ncbi:MAG: hypothetical protein HPM95_17705 [Alphaproteobacteria bacterium]|nr:hypothetical protein [Alphaproteobacteria bacterium]